MSNIDDLADTLDDMDVHSHHSVGESILDESLSSMEEGQLSDSEEEAQDETSATPTALRPPPSVGKRGNRRFRAGEARTNINMDTNMLDRCATPISASRNRGRLEPASRNQSEANPPQLMSLNIQPDGIRLIKPPPVAAVAPPAPHVHAVVPAAVPPGPHNQQHQVHVHQGVAQPGLPHVRANVPQNQAAVPQGAPAVALPGLPPRHAAPHYPQHQFHRPQYRGRGRGRGGGHGRGGGRGRGRGGGRGVGPGRIHNQLQLQDLCQHRRPLIMCQGCSRAQNRIRRGLDKQEIEDAAMILIKHGMRANYNSF